MEVESVTEPTWTTTNRTHSGRPRKVAHVIQGELTACGMTVSDYHWDDAGKFPRAPHCAACHAKVKTSRPGFVTTADLIAAGLNFRQVDYWTSAGFLRAVSANPGYGVPREYPLAEVKVAATMCVLARAGLTLQAAHDAARNGGELAPGVRVVIDEAAA